MTYYEIAAEGGSYIVKERNHSNDASISSRLFGNARSTVDHLYQQMADARVNLWQLLMTSKRTLILTQINSWDYDVIERGTRVDIYHTMEAHARKLL